MIGQTYHKIIDKIREFCERAKIDDIRKGHIGILVSDKNIIIPKRAIDEANIAPFTSKILTNEREI